MATATTNNKTTTTETSNLAQKIREQLLSTIQEGQKLTIDAAQCLAKVVAVLPVPDLPKIPGVPVVSSLQASSMFAFDVAADLLSAQRDFTLQLANVLAPAKSV